MMAAQSRRNRIIERRDRVRRCLSGLTVARHLGLEHARHSGERHKFACPRCGSSDGLEAYPEPGRAMFCYACRADVFDVVQAARRVPFAGALEFLTAVAGGGATLDALPLPPTSRRPTGCRPDANELAEFWSGCRRADQVADVARWLLGRALDPHRVAELDLVRAFPDLRVHRVPKWAWTRRGFALVTPMVDAAGRLASVRFRPVPGSGRQARGPYVHGGPSYSVRGLAMACPVARRMLAGEPLPERVTSVVIVEGEPDWMTWATRSDTSAVLGLVAGSWTDELAARLPDGQVVVVATDADPSGERYALQVYKTLRGRCDVRRLRPPQRDEAP